MTPAATGSGPSLLGHPDDVARLRAFWISVGVLALWAVAGLDPVEPGDLVNDLGIQYHLSGETLRGAIPIRDFEHGWNVLGWYVGAGLHALVGGSETLWAFFWEQVTGTFLAGFAVLAVGWRARLPASWLLGLLATWLALTQVPHGKYAIPSLWLFAFLPVAGLAGARVQGGGRSARRATAGDRGALAGRPVSGRTAFAVRALVAGLTLLLHIELAVMLAAGLGLYDLVGARGVAFTTRVQRALAAPLGMLTAFGLEIVFYAAIGITPAELVDFLLLDRSVTNTTNFGYPLLAPRSFLQIVYPATLVLAFVPAIWRRLGAPARLAASLHVTMGLIAIRKTDVSHVNAAATLLAVLIVLVAHDLLRRREEDSAAARAPHLPSPTSPGRFLHGLGGAAWFGLAVVVPFVWDSLLAFVVLVAACVLAALAARRGALRAASVGAAAAAAVLVATAGVGRVVANAASTDDRAELVAAAVGDRLDACLGDERRAWIVGGPLELYETLDVENPTPFYLFWQGFAREEERVERLVRDGDIPAIVKVNAFPASFAVLRDSLERHYEVCLDVDVDTTGDAVTVWSYARK